MGDEEQRAVVGREGLLELLDRGQVEVVGGLVEDEQVDAAGLQERHGGPGALAGREPVDEAADLVGLEAELGQQGAYLRRGHRGYGGLEGVAERQLLRQRRACLVDLTDRDAGAEGGPSLVGREVTEQQPQQGGLAGAVGAGDGDAVPRRDLERDRPEPEAAQPDDGLVEDGDDAGRPGCGRDVELEHPLLAGLLDLLEARDPGLHLPHLLGLLLRRLALRAPADLVVVGRLPHRVAHALRAPLPLGAGAGDEVGLLVRELLVGLAGVPPGDGPLLEVGVVPAVVDRDLALGEVELDDPRDAAREELPVVGDHDDAGPEAADERLQPLETGEVEVVRRLVEEHHVEPAEQQRGEGRTSRLTARERGHQGVQTEVETELGQHCGSTVLEVGRTARQPVVQRDGVHVTGSGLVRLEGGGCALHRLRRRRCAGAAAEVAGDRLAGDALVLLREPAHEGVRRRGRHAPGHRRRRTGEQPQQRRLPGAVGSDDPHHVTRGDGEVQGLEEGARPVATGQVLRDEGAGHGPRVVRRSVG